MRTNARRISAVCVTIVCLLLGMAACKEDTSYEERNAKLLAWLADEKQLLFDPYTVGDTLTFLTATGDTARFTVLSLYSSAEKMNEKGTWYRPNGRETEIVMATCTLRIKPLIKEPPSIRIYAHAWIDYQRDEDGNPIKDGSKYLYQDKPTIQRFTNTSYWPRRDTSTIVETAPPTPIQDNEYLYLTPQEERGVILHEWALVREGEGVVKIADAYGQTWEVIR